MPTVFVHSFRIGHFTYVCVGLMQLKPHPRVNKCMLLLSRATIERSMACRGQTRYANHLHSCSVNSCLSTPLTNLAGLFHSLCNCYCRRKSFHRSMDGCVLTHTNDNNCCTAHQSFLGGFFLHIILILQLVMKLHN